MHWNLVSTTNLYNEKIDKKAPSISFMNRLRLILNTTHMRFNLIELNFKILIKLYKFVNAYVKNSEALTLVF